MTSAPPSDAGSEVTVVEDERMAGLRTGFLAQRGRMLEKRGESLSIMCIGESTLVERMAV